MLLTKRSMHAGATVIAAAIAFVLHFLLYLTEDHGESVRTTYVCVFIFIFLPFKSYCILLPVGSVSYNEANTYSHSLFTHVGTHCAS